MNTILCGHYHMASVLLLLHPKSYWFPPNNVAGKYLVMPHRTGSMTTQTHLHHVEPKQPAVSYCEVNTASSRENSLAEALQDLAPPSPQTNNSVNATIDDRHITSGGLFYIGGADSEQIFAWCSDSSGSWRYEWDSERIFRSTGLRDTRQFPGIDAPEIPFRCWRLCHNFAQ